MITTTKCRGRGEGIKTAWNVAARDPQMDQEADLAFERDDEFGHR